MQQLRFVAFMAIAVAVMFWVSAQQAENARKQREAAALRKAAEPAPEAVPDPGKAVANAPAVPPPAPRKEAPRQLVTLGDGKAKGDFLMVAKATNIGAGIQELTLLPDAAGLLREPFPLLQPGQIPSFGLDLLDEPLLGAGWEQLAASKDGAQTVAYRTTARGGALEIVKRFTLEPNSYFLKLDVEFKNLGKAELDDLKYTIDGGQNLPIEGRWYTQHYRRLLALKMAPDGRSSVEEQYATAIADRSAEPVRDIGIQYAGTGLRYFASVIAQVPSAAKVLQIARAGGVMAPPTLDDEAKDTKDFANIAATIESVPFKLAPGAALKHEYLLFNGPKQPSALNAGPGAELKLESLITYQRFLWLPFDAISKGLMWILDRLYGVVRNYGIAIVLLTVIVRICLFPISLKQAKTMAKAQEKMAVMQPRLEELKKRYPNDAQKQQSEMMALYREHNFSPFSMMGGCLLAFLQLPIFVGLFQGMANHYDLRQQPFYGTWIKDLAAPDMLFKLPVNLPFLGEWLNILPLVWLVLLIWQIKTMPVSPSATPEQLAQQKAMQMPMILMMIVMGIGFQNKLPAGLCVYFVVSLTWSFFERKFLPKPAPKAAPDPSAEAPRDERSWKVEAEPKKSPKGRR